MKFFVGSPNYFSRDALMVINSKSSLKTVGEGMIKVSCRCKEYLCIKRFKNLKNIMYFKWIYEMFKKDWCDGNMAGLKRTTFFVN